MNPAPDHDAQVARQDWLAVMGHGHVKLALSVGTLADELAELWAALGLAAKFRGLARRRAPP